MIKAIFGYSLVFFSLFFIGLFFHENVIEKQGVILPFSLKKVYLFHLGFSLLICVNFKLFSTVDKVFEQLGFIYLGTLLLKIVLFCAIFYKSIFTEENLTQISRLSFFIPAIIFLLTETIFVAKVLNKKNIQKKGL
ncbi:MAG: DUF6168 family protein [Polaribacter sp.]|uniref:DUF6168 family protein n=2 Tax=Polaribacter TaxID=52959 RepID=UPI00260A7F03|nr:DUF6168 family protein [Polaribacter sp.]MDG1196119.1 DUF6168 family protein [Polaribacter sp.]MDG1404220.1 DUF6168 family protein [Polaribacter sp.]MDG2437073.1 DUF6168 family protein [Polaribacter sp.]